MIAMKHKTNEELILEYVVQIYLYQGKYIGEIQCSTPSVKGHITTWTGKEDSLDTALAAAYLKMAELQLKELPHE